MQGRRSYVKLEGRRLAGGHYPARGQLMANPYARTLGLTPQAVICLAATRFRPPGCQAGNDRRRQGFWKAAAPAVLPGMAPIHAPQCNTLACPSSPSPWPVPVICALAPAV